MPKADFQSFINSNPMLVKLQNDPDAQAIFDILNEDSQIYAAILATENGKPALSASINKIQKYILQNNSNFFASNFERQAVGKMQKAVLAPFGYFPNDIKKSVNSTIFTVATCYEEKKDLATMIIKITSESKA